MANHRGNYTGCRLSVRGVGNDGRLPGSCQGGGADSGEGEALGELLVCGAGILGMSIPVAGYTTKAGNLLQGIPGCQDRAELLLLVVTVDAICGGRVIVATQLSEDIGVGEGPGGGVHEVGDCDLHGEM